MKAIVYNRYGAPEVLRIAEVPKPAYQPNEVLIRVCATTVTRADVALRGAEPLSARLANGFLRPKKKIPGTELAGIVEAIGSAVTRFQPGERVYAATGLRMSADAEYVCVPEDGALASMPMNVSFDEAAALCEGMLTALPFLRDKAKLQPGQRILINGASGSVGSAAVQLAKYYGAEVTGVCSTPHLALVRSLGAVQVIDYTQQDFTQLGQTFDVVFDAAGVSAYGRCIRLLKPRGLFLETAPSPRIFYDMLRTARSRGKKAIITFTGLRAPSDKAKDLRWLKPLVEAGQLRAVIDRRFAMEQIVEAHRYVQTRHKQGNVVLEIAQP